MERFTLGRKPRMEYYGAIYHIIQRGNDNNYIFNNSHEKIELLNIIGEAKELFDFYLLAYCIMDNSFHLVIKTHNVPISKIMHRINTLYAKYYNSINKRTGSPFKGRYTSIIVDNEYNLFNLINYIHNNPVYNNIAESMAEYKWSSDVFFRMNIEGLVNIDYTLDILSQNRELAIKNYIELMNIFNEDFETLKREYEGSHSTGKGDNIISVGERRIRLEKILMEVCKNNKVDHNLIKKGSRKSYLMNYKHKYIEECLEQGFSLYEIAEFISLTERTVRRYIKKEG